MSVALGYYCYLTVRRLPPFFEDHVTRVVYSKIEQVADNSEIEHPSINGCLRFFSINQGLEIHHDGDLPARSGIGSSSAFTVGLLNALYALQEKMVDPKSLASDAIDIEQNWLEESVGVQDQIIAAFGGLKVIELGPGPDWKVSPLVLPADYVSELSEHILVGFSGFSRFGEDYAKAQIENVRKGETTAHLHRVTEIAREGLSLLIRNAEIKELGWLVDEHWKIKRQLARNLSANWMDELYRVAIENGAYGGKLMGAGGGGFFFFLAPPDRHRQIRAALSKIKVWVPFKIDRDGSRVIAINQDH